MRREGFPGLTRDPFLSLSAIAAHPSMLRNGPRIVVRGASENYGERCKGKVAA